MSFDFDVLKREIFVLLRHCNQLIEKGIAVRSIFQWPFNYLKLFKSKINFPKAFHSFQLQFEHFQKLYDNPITLVIRKTRSTEQHNWTECKTVSTSIYMYVCVYIFVAWANDCLSKRKEWERERSGNRNECEWARMKENSITLSITSSLNFWKNTIFFW